MKQTVFSANNIKRGGCVVHGEAALKKLPGIESAQFDIPSRRAEIRGEVDPATGIAALTQAGYPASVANS